MNTGTYKTEDINAYLLGNLPEEKAEVFDELSFTDADFADELSAAEKDLVDAYIRGELTGKTLERFETHYLASPLRRDKVEFAGAFQVFAEKEFVKTAELNEEEKPQRKSGFFADLFAVPKLSLQWGFALAALAFLVFGGWLMLENSRLQNEVSQSQTNRDDLINREAELKNREKELQDQITDQQNQNSEAEKELAKIREERAKLEEELKNRKTRETQKRPPEEQIADAKKPSKPSTNQRQQPAIATFILTPSLRGGGSQLQTAEIPAGIKTVEMRLELESDDFPAYEVALQNPSGGRTLWQSGKLRSKGNNADKFVSVRFPAGLLQTQIYTLEVTGITTDGTLENISSYSFRVVR